MKSKVPRKSRTAITENKNILPFRRSRVAEPVRTAEDLFTQLVVLGDIARSLVAQAVANKRGP